MQRDERRVRSKLLRSFDHAEAQADALNAVRTGDAAKLEEAINRRGSVVQHVDPLTDTPLLHIALANDGNPDTVRLLLNQERLLGNKNDWDLRGWNLTPRNLETLVVYEYVYVHTYIFFEIYVYIYILP